MQTSPPLAGPTSALAAELRAVTLAYDRHVVLSRVSLTVPSGILVGLVGPTGAGKSTLLRCLLGRHTPRSGEVRVLGRAAREARRAVGFVPAAESAAWGFPLSVEELVLLGRVGRFGFLRGPGKAERGLAERCLRRVGLEDRAGRSISELSPVQRRRCLIARALASDPDLLLVDEPWPAGANVGDGDLLGVLRSLCDDGMTVVVATGSPGRARDGFDRVALLGGRLVAEGPPPEVYSVGNLRATYGAETIPERVPAEHFAIDV